MTRRLHPISARCVAVLLALAAAGAVPARAQAPAEAVPTEAVPTETVADSLARLEARVAADPGDPAARAALAEALVAEGRQAEAIRQYEAVLAHAPAADVLRRLATLYSWNERPEDALAALERLAALAPDDLDVRRTLAERYGWAGRGGDAIRVLEELVARLPDDLALRRALAQQYAWNERPEDAAAQYAALLERDPGDVETLGRLAQQRLWAGDLADAARLYRRLVDARPDSSAARLVLGQALAWSGQAEAAVPVLERVLADDPDNGEALLLLGELQRWNGAWDVARERLRRTRALGADEDGRAAELLRGLRATYGPRAGAAYERVEDSNGLVRERVPLDGAVWTSRRWRVEAAAAWTRLSDGTTGTHVRGFDASAAAVFTVAPGFDLRAGVGVAAYSSRWAPATFELRLTRSFLDRIYATVRLDGRAAMDGVGALEQEIRTTGLGGEVYAQATSRLGLSATAHTTGYSDGNRRLAAGGGAFFTVRRAAPFLQAAASYLYEDTATRYATSSPYWTPVALSTAAARLTARQRVVGPVEVGGLVGVSAQRGVVSTNYGVRLGLVEARFHTLEAAYEKTGSRAYAAETLSLRYAYRF